MVTLFDEELVKNYEKYKNDKGSIDIKNIFKDRRNFYKEREREYKQGRFNKKDL